MSPRHSPEALAEEHDVPFDIVNTIRDNPEEFSEWHPSATAELYALAVFEDLKENLGYWF